MNATADQAAALSDLRVLDLADEKAVYCGKLLADLGADVIKVEPPGGDRTRNRGPFVNDVPHPEKSLYFHYHNTSKRSVTLDIDTADGRAIFRRLLASADVLLESFAPGRIACLGFGPVELFELNPRLILTSVTPFGQQGPYRDFATTDVENLAMAGPMYTCGFPQDPPNRYGADQSYYMASVHAATGTLMALYHRDTTSESQRVDVSIQDCCTIACTSYILAYDRSHTPPRRTGNQHIIPTMGLYPCRDGYVYFVAGVRWWDELVAWMDSEGMAGELKDRKWRELLDMTADQRRMMALLGSNPQARLELMQQFAYIEQTFAAFLLTHTKRELVEGGLKRRMVVAPVNTTEDLSSDPQLLARQFFVDLDVPEVGVLRYPGAPYRLTGTPWSLKRPAPRIGEHNLEIYEGELGIPRQRLAVLKSAGVI